MKRLILSVILIMSLLLTYIPVFGADEGKPITKYHLDMGVWSLPEAHQKLLNSSQTYNVNLAFNSDVEVEEVSWLDTKYLHDDNFWQTATMNCVSGEDRKGKYRDIYGKHTTSSLTNISKPKVEGKYVSYNAQVKLTGKEITYDIGETFKKYYADKAVFEEDLVIVSVPTLSPSTVKKYTDLRDNALIDYQTNIDKWAKSSDNRKKYYEEKAKRALKQYYYYKGLLNSNRTQRIEVVTTSQRLVDEDVEEFKSMIYSFWGGEANMKKGDAGLRGIYNSIEDTAASNMRGQPKSHWLVFFPTVLAYHVVEKEIPPEELPPPQGVVTGPCKDHVEWSETKTHTVYCSGCKTRTRTTTNSDGTTTTTTTTYCPGHTCHHTYNYSLDMDVSGVLTVDKPNGGSTRCKSGYGFTVTAYDKTTTADIKQTGNHGTSPYCSGSSKRSDATISGFTNSEVRLPGGKGWDVQNPQKKTKQPRIITLIRSGTTFSTPANPVSHYNNRLIYTGVDLPGTRQNPITHNIPVYFSGSWLKGSGINIELCGYINPPLRITINGNMYEDDSTQDNSR